MKDYVKYGRARDQLYNVKVKFREMEASIPSKHRTPELVQLLEMLQAVIEVVAQANENNQVVAMQLDTYNVLPLPGLEDFVDDGNENPYKP